jgi:hypothetical protein
MDRPTNSHEDGTSLDGLRPIADAEHEVRVGSSANTVKSPCSVEQRIFFISTDRNFSKDFASLFQLNLVHARI